VTFLDLFEGALADRADSPAYGDVTYGELDRGARRVALRLAALGLQSGERIALYTENRIGFVYAYLAALRSRLIVVPTNVMYRASDLSHVLENSGAACAIVSHTTREFIANVPNAPRMLAVEEVERWACDASIEALEPARAQPDEIAVVLYTSGTTGRSKGAMLTHGNLAAIAAQIVAAWRWTSSDVLLIALPLFHMHGLGAALCGTLAAGARIVVHERFDADRVLDELRSGAYTMFFGVPTMYVRLLERAAGAPVPPLRLYVSGSAALSSDTHAAFAKRFGAQILERYGATEFGFALSNRYGGPRIPGAVGVPTPGTSVRVVVPGGVEAVPPGEVGELLVAGPTVFKGYWSAPDATEAAFVADGDGRRWYRSGDFALYDRRDDVYHIVGRSKDLIISGGFNIYPREVEDEIERFAGVRACAVIGVPDPARGELPVAFVECDGPLDEASLLAQLRERIASYKVPKALCVVDELPRNALGKIEKARLKELAIAPPYRAR